MADDHDEMADLFSFGSSDAPDDGLVVVSKNSVLSEEATTTTTGSSSQVATPTVDSSFLDDDDDDGELVSPSTSLMAAVGAHDKDTQEILDWLDGSDDMAAATTTNTTATTASSSSSLRNSSRNNNNRRSGANRGSLSFLTGGNRKDRRKNQDDDTEEEMTIDFLGSDSPTAEEAATPKPSVFAEVAAKTAAAQAAAAPPPPPPEPVFASLAEALESTTATAAHIRRLATEEGVRTIAPDQRPNLYCRLVLGKTLDETVTSSLADSYLAWEQQQTQSSEAAAMVPEWVQLAALQCAQELGLSTEQGDQLLHLLTYQSKSSTVDPLLPHVSAVLLAAGLPPAATSVVVERLVAQRMPILALAPDERWEAARALHDHLYLLACYHLPLLVIHLDRYLPGWFGPQTTLLPTATVDPEAGAADATGDESKETHVQRARHLDKQGQIPPSWLLSWLAGEWHSSTSEGPRSVPAEKLLRLWDAQVLQEERSKSTKNSKIKAPSYNHHHSIARFFLVLAVLEQKADDLILLTGYELLQALQKALVLPDDENDPWWTEWWSAALELQKSTPQSVLYQLGEAEDKAVQWALQRRQERAEAALQARLNAEAVAHAQAMERKAEEARNRLTRARLVAFYRKHAPDKEANIDKILESYEGKLDMLEAKLFVKYGESFMPATKGKKQNNLNYLKTMNKGMGAKKSMEPAKAPEASEDQAGAASLLKPEQVSVRVKAGEILPIVCWTKGGSPKFLSPKAAAAAAAAAEGEGPLRFYLIDSRSEEAVDEQGRFPTAVNLSPQTMLDPDRMKQAEEMMEALRGAVHIVILGEGLDAIPRLYNQKTTNPKLKAALEEDESRTDLCALFFIKKGFPFVSVLDGGFCAAHAWLTRHGAAHGLPLKKVLLDYNPDSIFGQLESLHSASATEKAQRAMQNLIEKSLVVVTQQAQQLEQRLDSAAAAQGSAAGSSTLRLPFFGGKGSGNESGAQPVEELRLDQEGIEEKKDGVGAGNAESSEQKAGGGFRAPFSFSFARKQENAANAEGQASSAPSESDSGTRAAGTADQPTILPPTPSTLSERESNDAVTWDQETKGSTSNAGQNSNPLNMLKRNPFRFGGGAGGDETSDKGQTGKEEGVPGAGFMTALRKNTLGRMRAGPAATPGAPGVPAPVVAEIPPPTVDNPASGDPAEDSATENETAAAPAPSDTSETAADVQRV